ncbi:class II aldolase/adducin family protein [Pseudonocardia sp. KRD-291]|nr:class II aldolase/adducin family protein [Pseudonocardia sp. KRD291]
MRSGLAARCRDLAADGVVPGGAGNVSVRIDDDRVLITRRGLRFARAGEDDLTVVSLDGATLQGPAPSSEIGLHLGIHRHRPPGHRASGHRAPCAVVHTHGRAAVAVGLVLDELPAVHYSIGRLGRRVPTVPYHVFGSAELADAVGTAVADGAGSVLLRNHGSVSCGDDLDQAVEHAGLVEWLCEVYLDARALGEPALLSRQDLDASREQAGRLSYGRP